MEEFAEPKLRTEVEKLRPDSKFLPNDEELLTGTLLLAVEEKLRETFVSPVWRAKATPSVRLRIPCNDAEFSDLALMAAGGSCVRCELMLGRLVLP